MAPRPLLGEIELEKVQSLIMDGDQVLVEHGVPALEGDFLQRLGRRALQINLRGFLTGPEVAAGLKALRDKFHAAEPVPFVTDIATATQVDEVLIEEMDVRELAGKPARFEYAFLLREFISPPPTRRETPPEPVVPPTPPSVDTGVLIVEVIVEGQPNFDFSKVAVSVEGTEESGATLSRTLTNRTENRWTENEFPPGDFTAEALVSEPDTLSGSVSAAVGAGQTTQVQIILLTGAVIAKTFVVHFRFDKAFIEPCMREVLKQVASYASAHADEKLLIVGHTDKAGSHSYNQSLSERRARSVYAYLTFGVDNTALTAALAEWDQFRRRRTRGQATSINDTWGACEYQHILQDLGYYPGAIDGDHGPLTDDAVQAYRCAKGLPSGTSVDDAVWAALIEDYLAQDKLSITFDSFFTNCAEEPLKWLGCGEEDPLDRRGTAFRPSRRVELIFVKADSLPCEVPQPDTFDLPPPGGVVNSAWCLGPGSPNAHCCFVSPHLIPPTNNPQPCPNTPQGPWCRQPAEPGTIAVNGSIQRELPDGSLEPVPSQAFVLISPRGEFKADEQSNGEPVPGRTQGGTGPDRGTFTFADLTKGFYSLEVRAPASAPVLVRLLEDSDREVKGNAVCKALRSDQDRFDVVIINAPVLREIRLPVVVHLMTSLHPSTRAIRTCPDPLDPSRRVPQATGRTEADVQAFFEAANRIWRQARIRFELDPANIVRESYAFRTECEVDHSEFTILLERCAYPDAVNVFFIADLAGTGEAGFGVSPEGGAALGLAGCAVGDRFQTTILGPPLNVSLSDEQTAQVLAHELGHFLNLDHVDDTPANADRLMRPGTLAGGANRTLIQDEVRRARASQAASDDCVPLTLEVAGATRVGSRLSHHFILVQDPAATVTVETQIPARLLDPAVGTLVMTGGAPGATPLHRTVSGAATRVTEVVATYTPANGNPPTKARALIRVVTFRLHVEDATQIGAAGSTDFAARREPNQQVKIITELDPAPFCVPESLVVWTNGDSTADPLRRTVTKANAALTVISARLAGVTRSVTIKIIEVVFVANTVPPNNVLARVQIEGLLNKDLASVDKGDLFDTQINSLFLIRADLPGTTGATPQARLISQLPSGSVLETQMLTLTPISAGSDRFISLPILIVPANIPRAKITLKTPIDLEVIRAQSAGILRVEVLPFVPEPGVTEVTVRGRVSHLFVRAFKDSGVSLADVQRHIARAQRTWAQAGIEVKVRSVRADVVAPDGLLDIAHSDDTGINLTEDEKRLTGQAPNGPERSTEFQDFNIYYIRTLAGSPAGIAFPNTTVIALEGSVTDTALSHEMGHHYLTNWGGDEHQDQTHKDWPKENVMHPFDTPDGKALDRTQVVNVLHFTPTFSINGVDELLNFEP